MPILNIIGVKSGEQNSHMKLFNMHVSPQKWAWGVDLSETVVEKYFNMRELFFLSHIEDHETEKEAAVVFQ
jgi:hypothetical protein